MPETTPIPNDTAKTLIQNAEMRRYAGRDVQRNNPSRTAIYDASPIVKAGSRKWNAIRNANWIRDSRTGSRSMEGPFFDDQVSHACRLRESSSASLRYEASLRSEMSPRRAAC